MSSTSELARRPCQVVIVGGGFVGLNVARGLRRARGLEVTLVDRRNHHLFQPLLYQVAMAGLSPAEIAVPIRSLLAHIPHVHVLQGEVRQIRLTERMLETDFGPLPFDYLVLACGACHAYFGHDEWEEFAPGLKTLEQATEIRRRVLMAFENAERSTDPAEQKRQLTFVVIGGGPTGVELAGAIGEMTRYTLAKDFRRVQASSARILLLEAGPRILPAFDASLSERATRDLERLGVQVWTTSAVTHLDADGVTLGTERIRAATILWAAGVQASPLGQQLGVELDRLGRIPVEPDLSLAGAPRVFVGGDMAHCVDGRGGLLPGTAPVALQQGQHIARQLVRLAKGQSTQPFRFIDKGQMATIGRGRAIAQLGKLRLAGFPAWLMWLVVHIYYLTGFKNRLFVVMQWAWSYLSFRRGARLIVNKEWRTTAPDPCDP